MSGREQESSASSGGQSTSNVARVGLTSSQSYPSSIQAPAETIQSWSQNILGQKSSSRTSSSGSSSSESKERKWNTEKLGQRLAIDLMSAGTAGITVAPVVTIVDRAIIENASNRATLLASIRASAVHLLTRPHLFLTSKPFGLILLLYSGTYLSANLLDTSSATLAAEAPSTVHSGTSKFLATSATNLSLCVYKDNHFTRLFGAAGKARPVPPATNALFALRDSLTVFASFNLPPAIAPLLPMAREEGNAWLSRASAAQFLAPASIQALSTPLHLLGLDLYNRPRDGGVSAWSRVAKIARDWPVSFAARVARILPAFGVGGVVNTKARAWGMHGLEG